MSDRNPRTLPDGTPCPNPDCDHCNREERLHDVRKALANVLATENKAWPNYVRAEFAAARAVLLKYFGTVTP